MLKAMLRSLGEAVGSVVKALKGFVQAVALLSMVVSTAMQADDNGPLLQH